MGREGSLLSLPVRAEPNRPLQWASRARHLRPTHIGALPPKVGFGCHRHRSPRPSSLPSRGAEQEGPSCGQARDRAGEKRDNAADRHPGRASVGPQSLPGIDAVGEDLGPGPIRMGSRTRRRSSGIGMVNLTRCSSGGPGQGPVIGVRIAGARHEHLGRTHVSKKVTKLFRELVLMITQFTVAEREFKAIRWRHSKGIEGLVPLSMTNLGDVVRISVASSPRTNRRGRRSPRQQRSGSRGLPSRQ